MTILLGALLIAIPFIAFAVAIARISGWEVFALTAVISLLSTGLVVAGAFLIARGVQ